MIETSLKSQFRKSSLPEILTLFLNILHISENCSPSGVKFQQTLDRMVDSGKKYFITVAQSWKKQFTAALLLRAFPRGILPRLLTGASNLQSNYSSLPKQLSQVHSGDELKCFKNSPWTCDRARRKRLFYFQELVEPSPVECLIKNLRYTEKETEEEALPYFFPAFHK